MDTHEKTETMVEEQIEQRRVAYTLKRAEQALGQRLNRELVPYGLTASTYSCLLFLDQRPGISNADLARRAFVTPQTMIRIVAGLERDGLLTRHPHRQNGRILQTRLTSAGKDVLTRARPVVDRVQAAMLAPFTAIEQETLYQWLLTIAHTMEQQLEVADTAETERVAVPNAQPPRREEVDGRTNDESDA